MIDKPVVWIGSSRHDLRDFPDEARRKLGFELRAVQRGEEPSDFKPMPTIGAGVYEICIRTRDAFRVFYLSKFDEGLYVLHAFQKRTQKTSKRDITIGRERFKTAQEFHRQTQK